MGPRLKAAVLAAGLAAALLCGGAQAQPKEWIVASEDPRAEAAGHFEIIVIGPPDAVLPERIDARLTSGADERVVPLEAVGAASGGQRRYFGTLPTGMSGPVSVALAGRSSSVLLLMVQAPRSQAMESVDARERADAEPPISENDPMYFIFGARSGVDARFQLSFKYRLFDHNTGVGRERPWLAGLYLGYTQNSLWDLSSDSRPFRDTSYRPTLFWQWERTDDQTWLDGVRIGAEHESNGGSGSRSRSINTVYLRPEWRWKFAEDSRLEFTPKISAYVDKEENPDISAYRGYVDWRLRYDSGLNWTATTVLRHGTSGKGSVLVDLSRRIRDLRFGPVGGYLHLQFFSGYGEDILGYNEKRKSQLRIGFAIVP